MSLLGAATIAAFRKALIPTKASTCTLRTAASSWATSSTFLCHYEQASPKGGGTLDYESTTGYGFTVYPITAQTVAAGDRITVDGLTLEIMESSAAGNLAPTTRIWCTKR